MTALRYKYRWFVNDVRVYPTYPQGLSKQYTKEAGRVFFREKLNGVITFLRADFEPLWNVALDTKFTLVVQRQVNGVWTEYCRGEFYKTDEELDEDNRIIKLQIDSVDKYKLILAALDREFDVVRELMPPTYTVKYKKQGMLQIVFPEVGTLFSLIGDSTYTREITPYLREDLEALGFAEGGVDDPTFNSPFYGFIPGTGLLHQVNGLWRVENGIILHNNGDFRIINTDDYDGFFRWSIVDAVTFEVYYVMPQGVSFSFFPDTFTTTNEFTSVDNGEKVRIFFFNGMQRLLTDQTTVIGIPTLPLPDDDLDGIDFGYSHYVDPTTYKLDEFNFPFLFGTLQPEQNHTTSPTPYGRYAEDALFFAGEYFNPTLSLFFGSIKAYPVMQDNWREYSLTVHYTNAQRAVVLACTTEEECRDAYKLLEVFKLMIDEIDPSIIFESNITHSQFLFNAINPLTGDANPYTHFITPKTNIITHNYDRADPTEKLTLGNIEQLFNNTLNLHFYIDSQNRLRWEHIQFYRNGRSYTGEQISEDLTTQIDPRLKKLWSYHTKKYRYKKETLPEFVRTEWPEEVTDVFNGLPIKARSGFVQKGQTDVKNITAFLTDIDFALAFPSDVSKEGFFLFAAEMVGDTYTVPMVPITVTGYPAITVQNGVWAFRYMHDKYWKHNCSALDMTINGNEIEALSVRRAKEQELTLPSPLEPDPMLLIRSAIGVGEVETMDVNFTTRINKLRLLHNLDFDAPG
jgi:hypothetical protein